MFAWLLVLILVIIASKLYFLLKENEKILDKERLEHTKLLDYYLEHHFKRNRRFKSKQ